MRKKLFFIVAFSIPALLSAQLIPLKQEKPLSKSHKAIQQTVSKMFGALSNRDSVSLKNYCTADITLYEYGQVWNIDTLIRKAITQNQSADFKRTNSFEFINTVEDKNTAWVTYRIQSVIIKEGQQSTVQWLETVVLINERKQWRIKHLHSTLIKRA